MRVEKGAMPGTAIHFPGQGEPIRFELSFGDNIEIRMFEGKLHVRALTGKLQITPVASNLINIETVK